jgi:hypothetical protein
MSMETTRRPVRRLAMALAVAGVAGLGTVITAPAAAAAAPVTQDGPAYVVEGKGNGPDYFIVTGNKRIPIFYCDPEKPNKQHNKCLVEDGPRF